MSAILTLIYIQVLLWFLRGAEYPWLSVVLLVLPEPLGLCPVMAAHEVIEGADAAAAMGAEQFRSAVQSVCSHTNGTTVKSVFGCLGALQTTTRTRPHSQAMTLAANR